MALKFDIDIPGHHGPVVFTSPEPSIRTVRFWHVKGEGEIVGRNVGRNLMVRIILHDDWDDVSDLFDFLNRLDRLVGANETLEVTDSNTDAEYENCTFRGYEMLPLNGQEEPGPLRNDAGYLPRTNDDDEPENDTGWFIQVVLHFRQLLVPESE